MPSKVLWLAAGLRRRGPWLMRLALILGFTALPATPQVLVVLGPPQRVVTAHPRACVHTRLTDEHAAWKIQRTLTMVREMGAPTIVEYFPWAYHEPRPGIFDWTHVDQVLDFAANQGVGVIARLGMVPDWARPDPDERQTVDTYLEPARYDDFADFVYEFVRHTRGRVRGIIVWNEPNLALEWGFGPVDPEGYTDLLRRAYQRAKQADPEGRVLAGALAPTLEPVGSPFGMNELEYLDRMYAAGAGEYFDVLAAHTYGLTFPPDVPPSPEAINFRRVELLREVMLRHGDGAKPVMITESGWNDSPRWTKAVKPGARIAYTLAAVEWAEANWPWAETVCSWAFGYPAPARSYMDYYTFVTPDFQPKPIYEAYREWTDADR